MNNEKVIIAVSLDGVYKAITIKEKQFWEMYEWLYTNRDKHRVEDILAHAEFLGLNLQRFKKDMNDPNLIERIEMDKIEGVRAGVDSTPTLFINGKEYNLRHDEPFLKDVINEEAERIGTPPPFRDWDNADQ